MAVVLNELDSVQDSEDSDHHLLKLPGVLRQASYDNLLRAFRPRLQAGQLLLSPRSGELKKELARCARKETFHYTSRLLYRLFTKRESFPSESELHRSSVAKLRASPEDASLANVQKKLEDALVTTFEVSPERARRLELRNTDGAVDVRDCMWFADLGKLLVTSSCLPAGPQSKWKFLKAMRKELKAMASSLPSEAEQATTESTASASPLTSVALPLRSPEPNSSSITTSAPSFPTPSTSSASSAPVPVSTSLSSSFAPPTAAIPPSPLQDDGQGTVDEGKPGDEPEEPEDDVSKGDDRENLSDEGDDERDDPDEQPSEEEPLSPHDTALEPSQSISENEGDDHSEQAIHVENGESSLPVLPADSMGEDWTQRLVGDDLPPVIDLHPERDLQQSLEDTLPVFTTPPINCTIRGFARVHQGVKQQLIEIVAMAKSIVQALGHPIEPSFCCSEHMVEGFTTASHYSINLWPLLHRAYTRRELWTFLATAIAHLLVPDDSHGAQHGRMTEDLMARLLPKTDFAWAHSPQGKLPETAASITCSKLVD